MYKYQIETPGENTPELLNGNSLKNKVRHYYPSNIVGSNIVNAVTGFSYPDRVGTKGEANYYRVIEASGMMDELGRKLPVRMVNPQSNKLFYENKEQYLQHRGPLVDLDDNDF